MARSRSTTGAYMRALMREACRRPSPPETGRSRRRSRAPRPRTRRGRRCRRAKASRPPKRRAVTIASWAVCGRQPALDESGHAGREGQVDVRFRQAPEAPVGPHDAEVVRQREHRARGEGVPLQGGHGDHRQRQHPRQQFVDGAEIVLALLGVGEQPVQVQAVGVELPGRGGHQGAVALRPLHLIQGAVDLGDPVGVKAVLALPEVKDEDVVLAVKLGHRKPLQTRAIEEQAHHRSAGYYSVTYGVRLAACKGSRGQAALSLRMKRVSWGSNRSAGHSGCSSMLYHRTDRNSRGSGRSSTGRYCRQRH